ncbi:hypothetical protein DEO72_LG10g732 [Vigna unguiculata]|uniref:Uncharacterized protein n=1 Tax=Vigna unguiculata TaxID=3917 RepID=A0A4D6N9C8_VIGUN|nr:hypothetical protein DEO72_LG10g732 [Vigna unguiculata]
MQRGKWRFNGQGWAAAVIQRSAVAMQWRFVVQRWHFSGGSRFSGGGSSGQQLLRAHPQNQRQGEG